MGILSQFKDREEIRINRFFDYADRFAPAEIDRILVEHFDAFASNKFLGQVIIGNLRSKIAKACHITITPGMTTLEFTKEIIKLSDSVKRSLLVTILNDVCKLGVMQEAQAYLFLEDQLKKPPTPGAAIIPAIQRNENEKEKTT